MRSATASSTTPIRSVFSVGIGGIVSILVASIVSVFVTVGGCSLHDMRRRLDMRRGMMKYLYIILEVIASLISESETHDDDAYKDDLSEEFCWDMTHYLLPDV